MQLQFFGYKLSNHLEKHLEFSNVGLDRSHYYTKEDVISKIDSIKGNSYNVFEIEVEQDTKLYKSSDWVVTKFCLRIPFDDNMDLCVSIRPKYDGSIYFDRFNFLVVTAWINSRYDSHLTLDKSKYCSQEEWENENGK